MKLKKRNVVIAAFNTSFGRIHSQGLNKTALIQVCGVVIIINDQTGN